MEDKEKFFSFRVTHLELAVLNELSQRLNLSKAAVLRYALGRLKESLDKPGEKGGE